LVLVIKRQPAFDRPVSIGRNVRGRAIRRNDGQRLSAQGAGKGSGIRFHGVGAGGEAGTHAEEAARLKQLWKKLVRMFHPDLQEHDPKKRETYEHLTQAINESRYRGDRPILAFGALRDRQQLRFTAGSSQPVMNESGLAIFIWSP